jgi:NhaP-type Na+/H+ or K+/H+ antiporter
MTFPVFPPPGNIPSIHVLYAAIGGFITIFALASFRIKERLYLSEAFVATLFGVLIGPYALSLFGRSMFDDPVMFNELSRVVLGIQCFTAGIQTPSKFAKKEAFSLAMLLVPVLLFMYGISALIVHLVFSLGWKDSLIIAACITPTDPVLANVIETHLGHREGKLR